MKKSVLALILTGLFDINSARAENWISLHHSIASFADQRETLLIDVHSIYKAKQYVYARVRYWLEGEARPRGIMEYKVYCLQSTIKLGVYGKGSPIVGPSRRADGVWHYPEMASEVSQRQTVNQSDKEYDAVFNFLCKESG